MALALPMARVRRWVPPAPGMTPIRTSGCPNCASSPATMTSHDMASSQPPPSAKPPNGRDPWCPDGGDPVPRLEIATRCQALGRLAHQLADVGTGRECPFPCAGDDDAAAGRVGVERLKRAGQLRHKRRVQRIELPRPIEGDECHERRRGSGRLRVSRAAGRQRCWELDADECPGRRGSHSAPAPRHACAQYPRSGKRAAVSGIVADAAGASLRRGAPLSPGRSRRVPR